MECEPVWGADDDDTHGFVNWGWLVEEEDMWSKLSGKRCWLVSIVIVMLRVVGL